jgi:hypothetical protein
MAYNSFLIPSNFPGHASVHFAPCDFSISLCRSRTGCFVHFCLWDCSSILNYDITFLRVSPVEITENCSSRHPQTQIFLSLPLYLHAYGHREGHSSCPEICHVSECYAVSADRKHGCGRSRLGFLHSRRQSLDSSSGKQPTCFCFWSRSGLPHGLLRLREQPTMHLPLHSWKYRGHVLYILTPS